MSRKTIQMETAINKTYASTLKGQLVAAGWVSVSSSGKVICLMGYEGLDNPTQSDYPTDRTGAQSDNPTLPPYWEQKRLDNPTLKAQEGLDYPTPSDYPTPKLRISEFPPSTPHVEGDYLINKTTAAARAREVDEVFLARLQLNPRYKSLNVRDVYEKLLVYVEAENESLRRAGQPANSVASEKRLVNWLEQEDRSGTKKRKRSERDDWRDLAIKQLSFLRKHATDPEIIDALDAGLRRLGEPDFTAEGFIEVRSRLNDLGVEIA
ncbi:MAG: hypothetical protein WBV94_24830 [Blastocatellia bacterium]